MTAYRATFASGHTISLANSGTTGAGRVVGGSGFAGSRVLAEKAMASDMARVALLKRPRAGSWWHPTEVAAWKVGTLDHSEIVSVERV